MRTCWIHVLLLCMTTVGWAAPPAAGRILCAYWRELPGSQVRDLTQSERFPGFPDEQVYLDQLEIPSNQEGNFGTVIRGELHPPADGMYTFHIAANNQAELWISNDANAQGARLIASVPKWSMPRAWTQTPQQQSAPVRLAAGGRYFLEVRHKNGGGDNHLAVAWTLPDGTMEAPIPGNRLSPAAPVDVPGPKVRWGTLPQDAGVWQVTAEVEYLKQRVSLPMTVRLPARLRVGETIPAVVVIPDDGEPMRMPATRPTTASGEFMEITPLGSEQWEYDQRATIKAMAAAIEDLCRHYRVDTMRTGLIGMGTGGAAAWKIAAATSQFYRAAIIINGTEVEAPSLTEALRGTRVRIVTDIREGIATDCANRMQAALQTLQPKPEIVYLGEKELGTGSAVEYCMGRSETYEFALSCDISPTAGATGPLGVWRRREWTLGVLAAVAALVTICLMWRRQGKRICG